MSASPTVRAGAQVRGAQKLLGELRSEMRVDFGVRMRAHVRTLVRMRGDLKKKKKKKKKKYLKLIFSGNGLGTPGFPNEVLREWKLRGEVEGRSRVASRSR